MSTTQNSTADIIHVTVAAAVVSGAVAVIGNLVAVYQTDGAAGDLVAAVTEGVQELAKKAGVSVSQGQALYWDANNSELTDVADDGVYAGFADRDSAGGDATAFVALNAGRRQPRRLAITPGAEGDVAANAFDIALQQTLAEADKWLVTASDTNIHLSSQGGGSVTFGDGTDQAVLQLDADGSETLRALDNSGALAADVLVTFEPVDGPGDIQHVVLTYA